MLPGKGAAPACEVAKIIAPKRNEQTDVNALLVDLVFMMELFNAITPWRLN